MPPRFSLVYPTRHRPQFLQRALQFLEEQHCRDFEVIVSDNWVDPALSCQSICESSPLQNIRYVRPPEAVGMVANWNFAAGFATGEYVCVFTDKMFLLPDALQRVVRVLNECRSPDIVSWVSDSYQPSAYPDYFGPGTYTAVQADDTTAACALTFNAKQALSEKGDGLRSRYEQSPSQYTRGKIVFGAYHQSLIARIRQQCGALFFDISPDYTSMILALSKATSAVELKSSAVVSIATDFSNGLLGAVRDEHALGYLNSLSETTDSLFGNMLVPGMYAAQHNVVSHDYLALRKRFGLDFSFNPLRWLGYCIEDLSKADRVWSSPEVEQQQMALMFNYMSGLSAAEQSSVVRGLEMRVADQNAGRGPLQPQGQHQLWQAPSLREAISRRMAWA